MITSVRSALICDKVERTPEALTNYQGVHGHQLLAHTQPGLLEVWLTLHLDIDKRRTTGEVLAAAGDLQQRIPFDVTTDRGMTVIALPLYIPIQGPDTLVVTITDIGRRDKSFRFEWALALTPDARVLEPDVARSVLNQAAQANREVLASLAGPRVHH